MLISFKDMVERFHMKIKGIIHVGAHYGQEISGYNQAGVTDILLFEPLKSNYKKLKQNLTDGCIPYNMALGNQTGTIQMYVETDNHGMSSSILEPFEHLEIYPKIKFPYREEVYIDRLDQIHFNRKLYNMLIMDVQGYELEVLKGGVDTLHTIDYIYSEVNLRTMYKDCVLIKELEEFLRSYSFERTLLKDTNKGWGDALYIKLKNDNKS